MKSILSKCVNHFSVILYGGIALTLCLPSLVLAAGGGDIAPLVIVADTRHLPAFEAWWANLYNESHVYFTLVTVILIPLIGVIFGTIADFFMGFIGLDLKSRELSEH
ncbi:MAG: DVU0150 family protein [Desulfatirhabdiaceae bacterium]